jgi:hypothetical protein
VSHCGPNPGVIIRLFTGNRKFKPFQTADLLPQHVEGLTRHLRLTLDTGSGEALQEALAVSAQALINEEGLFTAIERFVGLPVPLPALLVESIAALKPQDRRTLIKRLLKICRSPISNKVSPCPSFTPLWQRDTCISSARTSTHQESHK